VITVAKVTNSSYYTDGNGGAGDEAGMESYYLDAVTEGEPPGRWMGKAAAALGLSGEVTAEAMETLFETAVNPVTGQKLGRAPVTGKTLRTKIAEALAAEPDATPERQQQIRAEQTTKHRGGIQGWDLTVAVPKSVSLAHAAAQRGMIAAERAGDTELGQAYRFVKEQIEAAIQDAAGAGLATAERLVTARATGPAGGATTWHTGQGLAAATFFQHTNRANEPHLHVHMVVFNKIQCEDGKWRAIDGQDVLAQQYDYSAVAARAIVEGITARLGLDWIDRPDGAGKELALIPEQARDLFSTRTVQTTAAMAPLIAAEQERRGRELTDRERWYIHRESQRGTRDRKTHDDLTADERNELWNARLAAETGRDMNHIAAALLTAAAPALPAHLQPAAGTAAGSSDTFRAGAGDTYESTPDRARHTAPGTGAPGAPGVGAPGARVAGWNGQWSRQEVFDKAIATCASRSATWGRANLKQAIEQNLPVLGIGVDHIDEFLDQLTDEALASADVVQITRTPTPAAAARTVAATTGADAPEASASDAAPGAHASGASGGPDPGAGWRFAAPSSTVYAAAQTLAAEAALRAAAVERGRHALDRAAVSAWLDAHAPTIGPDQRAAVEGIASSDAALTVLVGPAGTGKSFAGGALAAAWQDLTGGQGRLIGVALSDIATQVLTDDGISLSRNIDKWLAGQDRIDTDRANGADQAFALGRQDIVLVDESSMVSTRHLEAIRARVDAAGARLILTGDPRQLGPIEAGGVMGLLDGHAETYTLSEVRRFSHDWERAASLALRAGDPGALDEYDRHGRLVAVPTVDDAIAEAARCAVADRVAGRSTIVVTATNKQAGAVSAQVRDHLIDLGIVAPGGGVLLGRDGNTASVGDVIACRRNDYALGVTNRAQYRVLAVGPAAPGTAPGDAPGPGTPSGTQATAHVPEGTLLVERIGAPAGTDSGPLLLPAAYVAADVQLGYAGTVHASEGMTVDTAYNLTGGSHRLEPAAQYVAQTRGRHLNVAIVALGRPPDASAPGPRTARGGQLRFEDTTTATTPREVLAASLAEAVDAQTSRWHKPGHAVAATVAAERDAAHATSMATLTAQIEAVTRAACTARLNAHLDDAVQAGILDEDARARLGADQATEHLSRLLRVVEQDGRDPRQVLEHALTTGKALHDTRSVAQVLAHRITRGRPDHDLTSPAPAEGTTIPAGITPEAARRLAELHTEAAGRTAQLGRQTAEQAPDWAVLALGPVPPAEAVEDRADWEHRAGLVAAHREAVGDTHPSRALDRMPGLVATERRPGYAAAWHALGRPDTALPEAAMSDGRLRVRVQAWEREQAWAPPYVDDHLRAAETELQDARQAAAIATARAAQADQHGDPEQAAKWRAEADQQQQTAGWKSAAVAALTGQADTYRDWAAATAVTRDHAERAQAEADRRGLDLTTRPDSTPAATDYLSPEHTPSDSTHTTRAADTAADTADIAADDLWRPITDADLAPEHITDADRAWNDHTSSTHPSPRHDHLAAEHTPTDTHQAPAGHDHGAAEHEDNPSIGKDDASSSDHGAADHEDAASIGKDDASSGEHGASSGEHGASSGEDRASVESQPPGDPAPARSPQEIEILTAGASLALSVMADRASQEDAHTAAEQEDLAIETLEAGRRRRELADLDTTLTATGTSTGTGADAAEATHDEGAGWDD
jgi:conjugative relaxase-like TrwC/TraI family protein